MHADLRDLAHDPTVAQATQGAVDAPRHLGHRRGSLGERLDRKLGHSPETLTPGPA